jgi:hypothetical protein
LKELRAAKQAKFQARHQAVREEAQHARVQQLANATIAKAAERARKALER